MRYLLYILTSIFCLQTMAQSDSSQVQYYSDTCFQSSIGEYDRLLKYIIPNAEQVKTLYKVDVIQLALFQPNFEIEKHIKERLSLNMAFKGRYDTPYVDDENNYYIKGSPIVTLMFTGDVRFFHNYNNRVKKGKNTNGFSGNYFIAGLTLMPVIYNTDDYKIGEEGFFTINGNFPYDKNYSFINPVQYGYDFTPSLIYASIGYGLQRRIGNIGYIGAETKIGIGTSINFNHVYIPWQINIRAGFALSTLRFRK